MEVGWYPCTSLGRKNKQWYFMINMENAVLPNIPPQRGGDYTCVYRLIIHRQNNFKVFPLKEILQMKKLQTYQ